MNAEHPNSAGPSRARRQAARRAILRRGIVSTVVVSLGMAVLLIGFPEPASEKRPVLPGSATAVALPVRYKQDGDLGPMHRAVWEVLFPAADGPEPDPAAMAAAISGLGEGAIPPVIGLLCGVLHGPEFVPGTTDRPIHPRALAARDQVLLASLAALPEESVMREVRWLAADVPEAERLAAVGLLGRLATPTAQAAIFDVLDSLGAELLSAENVSQVAEQALLACMRAHPAHCAAMARRSEKACAQVTAIMVRSAGRLGGPGGARLLAGLLGRNAALDRVVLHELSRVLETSSAALSDVHRAEVRRLVFQGKGEVVRAALVVAGRVCDRAAFDDIAARLEDGDRLIAAAARWSLASMARVDLGKERAAWEGWFRDQEEWWELEGEPLVEGLEGLDPAAFRDATAQLAGRPLFRNELAPMLGPLILLPDGTRGALALAALERLGSPHGIPWLIQALGLEDGRRDTALALLRAWTGLDLGDDAAAWTRAVLLDLP
ncbi:MAG: hypothetical protein IPK67_03585 [Planctomycetes bacterium]|nr:hypothetical protein [Planctomycetota bacterium]